jgi:hypothetical protein
VRRPPLDPRTRKERKQAQREARAARRTQKYLARMAERGISPAECPPECPLEVYQMVQTILGDHHSRKTVRLLEEFERQRSGFSLALLREALGGKLDLRAYEDREVVAAFLVLYRLAERKDRKGEWCYLATGWSLSWLAGVMHYPGRPEARRHRSQLGGGGRREDKTRALARERRWGDHVPRRKTPQRAPVLQRLRDAGVLYAQQLPYDEAQPTERDTRGAANPAFRHTRNRYWLRGLNLQTLKRARGRRSKVLVEPITFSHMQARFAALQAHGSEWVIQLRHALERRFAARDEAPPSPS